MMLLYNRVNNKKNTGDKDLIEGMITYEDSDL